MPMYFPDLKSIQDCVKAMQANTGDKQYKGIYPETEEQLPEARMELGIYFRDVWHDDIQAVEVEEAVTKENYDAVMKAHAMATFLGAMSRSGR